MTAQAAAEPARSGSSSLERRSLDRVISAAPLVSQTRYASDHTIRDAASVFSALAGTNQGAVVLLDTASWLDEDADSAQLPVLPSQSWTSAPSSFGKAAQASVGPREQIVRETCFDLGGLREALQEACPCTSVQLLSGRIIWRSSQSSSQSRQMLSVYDIKRTLETELDADLQARVAGMKIFRSEDLEKFHASALACTTPVPLANNVTIRPGTRLTLSIVAEENQVDDLDDMLRGMGI